MDQTDLITARAPELSVLLLTATRDFFDIEGCWAAFREAKRVYGALGHGERVDLFEFDDTHGFSRPRREAAVRWMRRWLVRADDAPVEGDLPVLPDRDLQCTASGQVLKEFRGKSVFDLNVERLREVEADRERRAAARTREELLRDVRRRIGLPAAVPPARRTEVGSVRREGETVTRLVFDTEPGIRLPALRVTPKEPDRARPLVVLVSEDGKAAEARPGGRLAGLVREGHTVLAVDLRGMGELKPPPVGWAKTCGDLHEALLAMYLNRPLLGQRVYDLLAVLSEGAIEGAPGVRLVGVGSAGPVVLHAAALEERVTEVSVEGAIASWAGVVRTPMNYDQLANVVPGVLKDYDLPDLAAALAPRPLALRGAVYPLGHPVPASDVEETYRPARAAYARAGAKDRFILR